MTKMLLTAAILTLGITSAMAEGYSTMPKKFQGVWADAIDSDMGPCPLFIDAKTVSHCNRDYPQKLIKIEAGDENLNSVIVTWPFGQGRTTIVYRLIKSNGRQGLISSDSSSDLHLYWRR
jgi:hypothetical protein